MNKVILMGRLTKDPDISYTTSNGNQMAIARYTLAVDRRFKRDGEQTADFIRCVAFGRSGEFAEKYFHRGTKIVYTTDVVVENQEFAESKAASERNINNSMPMPDEPASANVTGNVPSSNDGFMNIPDNIDNSELPFNF